jgi:hypothetical protein
MNTTSTAADAVPGGDETGRSVRLASVIAGVGLLAMVLPALFGTLVVVDGLVTPGAATATATAIQDDATTFRLGIVALLAVAILDVIVAWALYTVFEPVNRRVSRLAMLFRIVYAGVFVVAIGELVGVIGLLTEGDGLSALPPEQLHAQAVLGVHAFTDLWNAGLLVFSVHLLLLGYLAYRAGYVPTVLGALLAAEGPRVFEIDDFAFEVVFGTHRVLFGLGRTEQVVLADVGRGGGSAVDVHDDVGLEDRLPEEPGGYEVGEAVLDGAVDRDGEFLFDDPGRDVFDDGLDTLAQRPDERVAVPVEDLGDGLKFGRLADRFRHVVGVAGLVERGHVYPFEDIEGFEGVLLGHVL